jgi:hypothetical protein
LKGGEVCEAGMGKLLFHRDISCAGAQAWYGPYGGSATHVL